MKKRTANLIALVVLGLALGGAWAGWKSWQTRQTIHALEAVVQSADLDALVHGRTPDSPSSENVSGASAPVSPSPAADAVDLALRGVDLFQGEGGVETWRLHADWATLRQESGLVEARDPHVRYALGEPQGEREGRPFFEADQYMDVTARNGRVEDNSRIILDGDVRAVYRDETLTGPRALYASESRQLVFPDGAELSGPRLSGRAGVLRWDLSTDILHGESGVQMVWTPAPGRTGATPPQNPPSAPSAETPAAAR